MYIKSRSEITGIAVARQVVSHCIIYIFAFLGMRKTHLDVNGNTSKVNATGGGGGGPCDGLAFHPEVKILLVASW